MHSALRAPAKAGFKNVPDVFVNLRPSPDMNSLSPTNCQTAPPRNRFNKTLACGAGFTPYLHGRSCASCTRDTCISYTSYSALRAPAKAGFKNVPDVFVNRRPSPNMNSLSPTNCQTAPPRTRGGAVYSANQPFSR